MFFIAEEEEICTTIPPVIITRFKHQERKYLSRQHLTGKPLRLLSRRPETEDFVHVTKYKLLF